MKRANLTNVNCTTGKYNSITETKLFGGKKTWKINVHASEVQVSSSPCFTFAFQRGPLSKCCERKVLMFILRYLLGINHHHGYNLKLLTIIPHGHQKRATVTLLLYSHTTNTTRVFGGHLREYAQERQKAMVYVWHAPDPRGEGPKKKTSTQVTPWGTSQFLCWFPRPVPGPSLLTGLSHPRFYPSVPSLSYSGQKTEPQVSCGNCPSPNPALYF